MTKRTQAQAHVNKSHLQQPIKLWLGDESKKLNSHHYCTECRNEVHVFCGHLLLLEDGTDVDEGSTSDVLCHKCAPQRVSYHSLCGCKVCKIETEHKAVEPVEVVDLDKICDKTLFKHRKEADQTIRKFLSITSKAPESLTNVQQRDIACNLDTKCSDIEFLEGQLEKMRQEQDDIISRLPRPTQSQISLERKLPHKRKQDASDAEEPPKKAKRAGSEPANVTVKQRLADFEKERALGILYIRGDGHLACRPCARILKLKKSSIASHLKSTAHEDRTQAEQRNKSVQEALTLTVKASQQVATPGFVTLPEPDQVFRLDLVRSFMQAGIPLNKLASGSPMEQFLLRRTDHSIPSRATLSSLITPIRDSERESILRSVGENKVAVIFDGGCRLGEMLGIVLRYVDTSSWTIHQKLVSLATYTHTFNAAELAAELIDTLTLKCKLGKKQVYAFMRDSAATNGAAMTIGESYFRHAIDMNCISHTLDHVGGHFRGALSDDVVSCFLSIMSHSTIAKAIWRDCFGKSPRSVSATRWWSRYEFACSVGIVWDKIDNFVDAVRKAECSPAQVSILASVVEDLDKKTLVGRQLKVLSVVMLPFVKTTYNFEGDGFLLPLAFDELDNLISLCNSPNDVLRAAGETDLKDSREWILPALSYFSKRMNEDCASRLLVLRRARIFNPLRVLDVGVKIDEIESLATIFPWLEFQNGLISQMIVEWAKYKSRAKDFAVPPGISFAERASMIWDWWMRQRVNLPAWSSAVALLALVQPSSAAMERVYSIVRRQFDDKQTKSLMDYVEGSVMLEYNNRPARVVPDYSIDIAEEV